MLNPNLVGQSFKIMTNRTEKLGSKLNIVQEVNDIDSELFLLEHHDQDVSLLPDNYPIALNQNIKKIHFKNSPYRFQIKIAKLTSNYDLKTVELFNQIKEFS